MTEVRLLVVDDEQDLADSLAQQFRREGYGVDIAYDGDQAWWFLEQSPAYDVIILDWMLPSRSGVSVCEALRSRGDQTPIVFLTARDTLDDRVTGLDAGADDYLVKPFELRELLARVRAQLRRRGAVAQPERWVVGALALDADGQVVYVQEGTSERAITLSEKETSLLRLLMQHAGQLVSHEHIYTSLWPASQPPSSNVLAAQVRLLRRKIEPIQIDTVYGKGYRLGGG